MVVAVIKKAHFNTNPTPVVALARSAAPLRSPYGFPVFYAVSLSLKIKKVIINLKNKIRFNKCFNVPINNGFDGGGVNCTLGYWE